ncbi:MAG TPA: hypothetical protein VF014_12750 [Casimicrobiaceae bacterium]|nr:hypothetical protein [Casimicrobiaceae bacterium]
MPTPEPYFPLGEPPYDDVEAAAKLLAEYQRQGLTGPEFGSMFFRMVADPDAVVARAEELAR